MDHPFVRVLDPERVAADTHLVRLLAGEGINPLAAFCNSMVITGAEPVIVDCGPAVVRDEWLETTFSLVDPRDVRWIFLSHDDHDHTGNLEPVLELCADATLVTTSFMVERLAAERLLPLDRMRWVNDGESFIAGDRVLTAVTPPTFDSPTTRGLFDSRTNVYWAVDSFGAAVPAEIHDVDELDPALFRESFSMTNRMISPWHQWLDPAKYSLHLERIRRLGATTIASAHGAPLRGAQIDLALGLLAELPSLDPVPPPGQAELDGLLAAMTALAVPA